MSKLHSLSIAIVGAGIAGLTAATALARRGASVTVHDAPMRCARLARGCNSLPMLCASSTPLTCGPGCRRSRSRPSGSSCAIPRPGWSPGWTLRGTGRRTAFAWSTARGFWSCWPMPPGTPAPASFWTRISPRRRRPTWSSGPTG
ncbi:hypothetical protein DPM13_11685 [Paracoccus mutanolyticus]|uniref:FAD dependent oxidoreductase domain-containing protein n=1 Tax=Paracoccus mutanolyticus TaxID=1499308 RepID=A0ABM6WSS4_9RHOB|nr:hypothetical protein DPM13_11685 [Paracoccus mutanolyticus]